MAYIQTPNGKFHYKTRALYPGVKPIEKEKALENLLLLKDILDANHIPFMLSYGTLLGAVREHDFITHDEDIDLTLKDEYRQKFLSILPLLRENGLELVRYDRRGLYSLMRNGEYIDLYFFVQEEDGTWECGGNLIPDAFMQEPEPIEFKGYTFMTHSDYIGMVSCEYGENWQTPCCFCEFGMPAHKRILFYMKEKLKDILPDFIYMPLAKRCSQRLRGICMGHIKDYQRRTGKKTQE